MPQVFFFILASGFGGPSSRSYSPGDIEEQDQSVAGPGTRNVKYIELLQCVGIGLILKGIS
jgi:hypothetical protein